MAQLQQQRSTLEGRLAGALPPAELADIGRTLKSTSDELQKLEERWLALSDEMDNMAS
jgi:ATP-binding cassette subfamily F protein 3